MWWHGVAVAAVVVWRRLALRVGAGSGGADSWLARDDGAEAAYRYY